MVDDIRTPKRDDTEVVEEPKTVTNEESFSPPEVVSSQEEIIDMAAEAGPDKTPAPTKPKKPRRSLKAWWGSRSKKQKIILIVAVVVCLALIVSGAVFVLRHGKQKPVAPKPTVQKQEAVPPPKPTTEASHLTGIQVAPEYNQLPVTGIMIENSPDARPQSGLKDAGVVFEAIAEGGITRFLALYQEAQPDYVGPVRSARPYYLQWLLGFDAALAHVGGSPDALGQIKSLGVKDLDQFFNGGAYQRITARYAPHNVYTSLGSLLALEKGKGYTSSSFTSLVRKADKPLATPTVWHINIGISAPLYNPHYDYDSTTNTYKRSEGGLPHKDERSGQQISPKVVIALVMPQGIAGDGLHTTYNTLGSGKAYIFQDGSVTEGVWQKSDNKGQFVFGDANGAPIGLNAGQTWISIVGGASNVSYSQ